MKLLSTLEAQQIIVHILRSYQMLTQEQLLQIHNAIHQWNGIDIKYLEKKDTKQKYQLVLTPKSKCRAVIIDNYKFIEQNKNSNLETAIKAREGSEITWIIPLNTKGHPWGKIVDGVIEVYPHWSN